MIGQCQSITRVIGAMEMVNCSAARFEMESQTYSSPFQGEDDCCGRRHSIVNVTKCPLMYPRLRYLAESDDRCDSQQAVLFCLSRKEKTELTACPEELGDGTAKLHASLRRVQLVHGTPSLHLTRLRLH